MSRAAKREARDREAFVAYQRPPTTLCPICGEPFNVVHPWSSNQLLGYECRAHGRVSVEFAHSLRVRGEQ